MGTARVRVECRCRCRQADAHSSVRALLVCSGLYSTLLYSSESARAVRHLRWLKSLSSCACSGMRGMSSHSRAARGHSARCTSKTDGRQRELRLQGSRRRRRWRWRRRKAVGAQRTLREAHHREDAVELVVMVRTRRLDVCAHALAVTNVLRACSYSYSLEQYSHVCSCSWRAHPPGGSGRWARR